MKRFIIVFAFLLIMGSVFGRDYHFINEDLFGDDVKVIACVNSITLEIKDLTKNGNCFWGTKGWQNIMLPTKEQFKVWKEVFPSNDWLIINRLAVPNFESAFRQDVRGSMGEYGYVQIIGGFDIDLKGQITFLKDTWNLWKTSGITCNRYLGEGYDRVLRCLYSRHNGRTVAYNPYSNKAMKVTNFYRQYFLSHK